MQLLTNEFKNAAFEQGVLEMPAKVTTNHFTSLVVAVVAVVTTPSHKAEQHYCE